MSNLKRLLTAEEKAMAAKMKAIIAETPGMTEESVAAAVGVSQGQISHWTGARLPVPANRATAVANALGIADPSEISLAFARQMDDIRAVLDKEDRERALEELHHNRRNPPPYDPLFDGPKPRRAKQNRDLSKSETQPGYVRFDLLEAKGGAGPGVVNLDYPEVLREVEIAEWQLLRELGRVPSPSRVKLLTVRGNSMSPRIREGDVVFVDVEDTLPVDGAIFAVIIHDETLVKQIERRMDGIHIVSLAYPERPDIIPPDKMDSLRIAGRVLGAIQLRKAADLQM